MIHAAALLIISQQRLRHLAAQAGQLRVLFRGQPGLLRLIGEIPEAEEAIPPRRPVIWLFLVVIGAIAAHNQRIGVHPHLRIPPPELAKPLQPGGNGFIAVRMDARRHQPAVQQGVKREDHRLGGRHLLLEKRQQSGAVPRLFFMRHNFQRRTNHLILRIQCQQIGKAIITRAFVYGEKHQFFHAGNCLSV